MILASPRKRRDRAEDLDEDLLQHVLEVAAAGAEHAMQVARDLGAIEAIELAERFLLATLAAGDQVGLRRGSGDGVQLSGVHPVPWWIVPRKTFSAGSSCSYLLLVRVASWTISTVSSESSPSASKRGSMARRPQRSEALRQLPREELHEHAVHRLAVARGVQRLRHVRDAPARERARDRGARAPAASAPASTSARSTSPMAGMIDHTLLKADATAADVKKLCEEARKYCFASVCVNSTNVGQGGARTSRARA